MHENVLESFVKTTFIFLKGSSKLNHRWAKFISFLYDEFEYIILPDSSPSLLPLYLMWLRKQFLFFYIMTFLFNFKQNREEKEEHPNVLNIKAKRKRKKIPINQIKECKLWHCSKCTGTITSLTCFLLYTI